MLFSPTYILLVSTHRCNAIMANKRWKHLHSCELLFLARRRLLLHFLPAKVVFFFYFPSLFLLFMFNFLIPHFSCLSRSLLSLWVLLNMNWVLQTILLPSTLNFPYPEIFLLNYTLLIDYKRILSCEWNLSLINAKSEFVFQFNPFFFKIFNFFFWW